MNQPRHARQLLVGRPSLYMWRMETVDFSSPTKSDVTRRVVFAIVGILIVGTGFWTYSGYSRVIRKVQVSGTVISVASAKSSNRYFIRLDGSQTIIIPGPPIVLYPSGSTVLLERRVHENGSIDYQFPHQSID
ncbi:hypothetical protein [Mesorhizobium amorphae]